ncbi:E3 ubiquitin- ligase RNF169 [Pelobates cultripes]|uniref:E3 ubiquitin- ligase RNF169 n=1 Tax=Pelobates cultripes TaxID=61616 RepID=A0AAD1VMY0_PELCU|nr:E3 ubiquitin- ligase RNF169 [Pelobates cultripes]
MFSIFCLFFFQMKTHFVERPDDLCSVNVSDRNLTSAHTEDFLQFTCVAYMNASENRLLLEDFSTFPMLRELDISLNEINRIHIKQEHFPNLEVLDLSYNNLSPDDISQLSVLPQLRVLHLTGNRLTHLPPDMSGSHCNDLMCFPSLEILMLDNNRLSHASVFGCLANLKRLHQLNLDKNGITKIPYLLEIDLDRSMDSPPGKTRTEKQPTLGGSMSHSKQSKRENNKKTSEEDRFHETDKDIDYIVFPNADDPDRTERSNHHLLKVTYYDLKATQLPKSKVSPGSCPASGILGILLSTENSRSFSAPVLTSEKRLAVTCLSSFTPLHKPERSISPDSNDSISEELNHFKPIVCSPCTPPKRLPDGRVLSPVIIKSTPRNLRKSLQKPTTYEASPLILKKWEQVFQERQMKKTSSKGTLTSSVDGNCPTVNNPVPSSKEFTGSKIELHVTDDDGCRNTESLASNTEILLKNSSVKIPDLPGGGCLSSPSSTKDLLKRDTNLNVGTKDIVTVPLTTNIKAVAKCKCIETISVKPMLKQPCKYNSQTINIQNGKCFTAAEHISPVFSLRRGQKRLCKTKHLEPNGSFKRLKVTCSESCSQNFELLWREAEKRQQEEEDKKLALKLQQMFDKETRTVNRCKGSRDEYPLRSKSTASAN